MGIYPGLGLPVRDLPARNGSYTYRPVQYPTAAQPTVRGSESVMLPVREVAMTAIMDSLTDKKDWHKKVYNNTITEKWREEAMEIPDQALMATAATPSKAWYGASQVDEDSDPVGRPPVVEGVM